MRKFYSGVKRFCNSKPFLYGKINDFFNADFNLWMHFAFTSFFLQQFFFQSNFGR